MIIGRLSAMILLAAGMVAAQSGQYYSRGISAIGTCVNGPRLVYDGSGGWQCSTTLPTALPRASTVDISPSAATSSNPGNGKLYYKNI